MLFFRSKGVATPLLRKNRKKKTLNLQHYHKIITDDTERQKYLFEVASTIADLEKEIADSLKKN
jgi:hypothetical protein